MLKFLFWSLVAANVGLLAYGQGYLGQPAGSEREPARLARQIEPARLVQLTAVQAKAAVDGMAPVTPAAPVAEPPAPTPATVAAAPAPDADLIACVQAGPLGTFDARRFETRLASLELGTRQTRIDVPFQEITNRLVYLPPDGGREGAQKRVADLKERGVENYFIMQGDPALRHAVSLGVFKTEGAAQKLVAELQKKGVRGVRVLARGPQGTRPAFQFRGIAPELRRQIAGIAGATGGGALRDCD